MADRSYVPDMGIVIVDARDLTAYNASGYSREREVGTMDERAEYAIAGTYTEFMNWRNEDPEARRRVIFVNTAERAELLARWAPKGLLHRVGRWERSPAREAAIELEV